eukprot:scaffold2938_cov125-Isochrysis_galbana.AAC.6
MAFVAPARCRGSIYIDDASPVDGHGPSFGPTTVHCADRSTLTSSSQGHGHSHPWARAAPVLSLAHSLGLGAWCARRARSRRIMENK